MATSDAVALATPLTDGGVRSVYFFNGRLLTANDLAREQTARNEVDARLGRAIGDGIVTGLEVAEARASTRARPVVSVAAGLAVNRCGNTLSLANAVDVVLVRDSTVSAGATTGFGPCRGLDGGTYIAGSGVYLLVLAPAFGSEGRVATSGIDPSNARCNTDTTIAGVQFRLLEIDSAFTSAELADEARLRNRVAYACFGSADLSSIEAQPFGPPANGYGLLERFRGVSLGDDDVPLSVLYWTSTGGIVFIDLWSVRRRTASTAASPQWTPLYSDHRDAEAEAALFEFGEHIAAIRREGALPMLAAESRFVYLPAAGYLPTGADGADWKRFLGAHAPDRETPIDDVGLLRAVVRRSFGESPVRVVPATPAPATPPIRYTVYRVSGRNDFVLFARSALGETVARDVYYDATRCALPGVRDVQSAIDALCTAAHCCTLVVSPVAGWERAFDAIAAGQDALVCFQAGTFTLTQPLIVRGKGRLRVTGAGLGSRIVASASETAMRFESCDDVRIADLAFEARATGANATDAQHLNGAVTIVDCPSVHVEGCTFQCAAGVTRAASCITIRSLRDTPAHDARARASSARVRHCEFVVGHQQVGLLMLDVARVHANDNSVRLGDAPDSATLAADPHYRPLLRRRLISRYRYAANQSEPPPAGFNATALYGNLAIHVATDPSFVRAVPTDNLWTDALRTLAPRNVATPGRLAAYIEHLTGYAILNGGEIKGFASVPLANLYHAIAAQLAGALAQGIVVAGEFADDVRIIDNTIQDAVHGVHIGVSRRGGTRREPESTGVVVVARNTLRIALTPAQTRERHGIFVGNATSVLVTENRLVLQRSGSKATQPIEGIRLVGHYGPRVIVRANDLDGFNTGIVFEPRRLTANQSFPANPQWIVTDNFAKQATNVLTLVMDDASKAKVRGRLDNYS